MLAYVLAWVIGLGSLGLYLAAFFLPEIHRKNDFIWSGLGLFYALVLWVYAQRITGGILLGQTASVALISWLGWETLKLRRQLTPSEQQTELPDSTSIQAQANLIQEKLRKQPERIAGLFTKAKSQVQGTLGAVTPRKGKSGSEATQPIQPPQAASVGVRNAETLEKDKLEVVPPQAVTDEAVEQDQIPAKAAPIIEEVKPEIEVTPQSTTDEAIAKPDQEFSTEITPTAKSAASKIVETEVASKDTQIKAASTKDNLQAKFTELQTKLADLPIRESWNKLSEQATSLFANVKDRVQGIISTVTQRNKPGVETTQQPTAPSPTIDSTTAQDSVFDQAERTVETASAIVIDEAVTGSTPVEDVELRAADEEASLTSEAATAPETTIELEQPESITITEEIVTEEVIPEADSVARQETDAAMPPASSAEAALVEETTSDLSAPEAEVEAPAPVEMAPEVEVAPETEPDWPPETEPDWSPEPEPDWSSESESPVTMEAVPPEAAPAEPEAPPPSPDSESPPPEDKEQKQNPSSST